MNLNNLQRIFSIILIAFPSLYCQIQDTTAKVLSLETVLDSIPAQIAETVTDKEDSQDPESQIVSEEPIIYTIPAFDKLSGFTVGWSINQPINSGE